VRHRSLGFVYLNALKTFRDTVIPILKRTILSGDLASLAKIPSRKREAAPYYRLSIKQNFIPYFSASAFLFDVFSFI